MSKILIIDSDGVGLSFAWRCVQAGHEVKLFLANKPSLDKSLGDGFKGVTKVPNWVPHILWADLVFPTSNDLFLERLGFFRKKGAKVFGSTAASAELELDPKTGRDLCKKAGLNVAEYTVFPGAQEMKAYVENSGIRYVFKSHADKPLTYASKHAADLLNWMDRLPQAPKGAIMLQEFVEGIEFGVSRWMGKDGFVGPWNESFAAIAAFSPESKIGEETLAKLEKDLTARGHTGNVALSCSIDAEGKPWILDCTCRPSWPIFNMMLGATEGDPAEWMIAALAGEDKTSFKTDIGCCLEIGALASGRQIYGVTKGNKKHLHPQEVKIDVAWDMDKEGLTRRALWTTAGKRALGITGYGNSVKQCTERAYKTSRQLALPEASICGGLGESLKEQLPILHKHGYAKHFNYEAHS